MLRIFILCCSLSLSLQLGAVDISWVGGSGHWNNPSNWSTGSIPTTNDNVFVFTGSKVVIPSGYTARARSVEAGPGAYIWVAYTGRLQIFSNSRKALKNYGKFSLSGTLEIFGDPATTFGIENVGEFSTSIRADIYISQVVLAMENSGSIVSGANITIEHIGDFYGNSGIRNLFGATFRNNRYGTIIFSDLEGGGIGNYSGSSFINEGEIAILEGIGDRGIFNNANFINSGGIFVYSFTQNGVLNQGVFENTGEIRIYTSNDGSGNGLNAVNGEFTNHANASLYIDGGDDLEYGIRFIGANRNFLNEGDITVILNGSGTGILAYNNTNFTNQNGGQINVSGNSSYGIEVRTNNFINNDAQIVIDKSDGYAFYGSYGLIENDDCGTINTNRPYHLHATLVINRAWLEIQDPTAPHHLTGNSLFWNEQLTYDPGNSFGSLRPQELFNNGLIIGPITGTISSGVHIYDVLQIGSFSSNIASNWTEHPNGGQTIGIYNQNTNRLLPDFSSSDGLSEIFALFEINVCSEQRVYGIPLVENAQPLGVQAGGAKASLDNSPMQSRNESEQLGVFPNPIATTFQLRLPAHFSGQVSIDMYTLSGQLVKREVVPADQQQISLNRPSKLVAGIYLLRVYDASGAFSQRKIILQ